jgi:hypothetical protein
MLLSRRRSGVVLFSCNMGERVNGYWQLDMAVYAWIDVRHYGTHA